MTSRRHRSTSSQELVEPINRSVPEDIPSTQTFNQSYRRLDVAVQKLRQTGLENIDDLVPLVEEATGAYKDCKNRLDAVERLLQQSLGNAASTSE